MAKGQKNSLEYYPHKMGDGKKMFFIDKKYGNDGYATWHKILEKICTTDFHYLNLNEEQEVMYLASKCNVSESRLIDIINDLVKLDAFDKQMWEYKIIWSHQFIESVQEGYRKRSNSCITFDELKIMLVQRKTISSALLHQSSGVFDNNHDIITKNSGNLPQRKVEESKVNKSKGEKEGTRETDEFLPPSFDDVKNYLKNKGWAEPKCETEAEAFIDYYAKTGWQTANGPIKKWDNAASGWMRNDGKFEKEKKGGQRGSKKHPDTWSRVWEQSLSNDELKDYWKHLRELGFVHKNDRWHKPTEA